MRIYLTDRSETFARHLEYLRALRRIRQILGHERTRGLFLHTITPLDALAARDAGLAGRPRRIASLPTRVNLSDVQASASGAGMPLALGVSGANSLVTLDLANGPSSVFVVGPPATGRTTALRAMACHLMNHGVRVALVTPKHSALADLADHPNAGSLVTGPAAHALDLDTLRSYRQRLITEEERASYWRRLVHGRMDLLEVNAKIVRGVAENVARYAPDAVVIVVSNPLDEMTALAQIATGADRIYWSIPTTGSGVVTSGSFVNYSHFCQFMNLSLGAGLALILVQLHEQRRGDSRGPLQKTDRKALIGHIFFSNSGLGLEWPTQNVPTWPFLNRSK